MSNQEINMATEDALASLKQQLRYEKALANCSRSLLLMADDEPSQQQVLSQGLDHLLIGAQTSRAYVFQNF